MFRDFDFNDFDIVGISLNPLKRVIINVSEVSIVGPRAYISLNPLKRVIINVSLQRLSEKAREKIESLNPLKRVIINVSTKSR